MSKSNTSLKRLFQIRKVFRQYGLVSLFDDLNLSTKARLLIRLAFGSSKPTSVDRATRIRKALEELGPVFVKLGQALSTRPDLLPLDIAQELSKLQDQVPPFKQEEALAIIKDAFGDEYDAIFESVEQEPMASASVAQVHAAILKENNAIAGKNGKAQANVIIKVLRPGIEKTIDEDLKVMYLFAGLLQKHWARGEQFKPLEVIKEYDYTIHDELDLRTEAANCCHMGDNFKHTDIIYVPTVYWDYTHQNVMVMERIYGTSIREIDTLRANGFDLAQLANDGVEVFFKQAFEDNFFHADMHPGNIFVSDQGKWISVDFGIMGTLTEQDKQYLGEMLLGFFNRDYRSIAQAHLRAEWVPHGTRIEEFETAIRTVCEPIFAKPISEISFGKVLLQLFQTVQHFEIPLQPQLVLLYKTLLNIEGLGRQLYPDLNLWDTAKPFLEDWMKKQLSPQVFFDDVKRDWPRWRAILPKLPDLIESKITDSSSGQDQITQLQHQLELVQQNTTQKSVFHLCFGLGLGLSGLVIFILSQNNLIINSNLTQLAPWIGSVGVLWAYYKS